MSRASAIECRRDGDDIDIHDGNDSYTGLLQHLPGSSYLSTM
jgi:hypothetical protein